jgi:hypothetical protein
MTIIKNIKTSKKTQNIDQKVVAQAKEEMEWDEKIEVTPKTQPTSIRLSSRTIERAKFFAHIHHERGYQSWLKQIIEERIDNEYEMYKRLKKDVI